MATEKTDNMFTLSGFARVYVKNGQAYGVCLCGTQETDGNKTYVNVWKKVKDGNVKITTNKQGKPVLHIAMIDIETVNKTDKADVSDRADSPEADKQRKAVAAEEAKRKGKKKSSGWGGLEPADDENLPF